jgi:hypothetical protein
VDSLQVALLNDMTKNLVELNRDISEAHTYLTSAGVTEGLLHELTKLYRQKYNEMISETLELLSLHEDEAKEFRDYQELSDLFKGKTAQ